MADKAGTEKSAKKKVKTEKIWTGTEIQVGIYKPKDITIAEAQVNIIKKMLRFLPKLKKSSRVLILGSGLGGTALYLHEEYGCKIECLNENAAENAHLQEQIAERGIEKKMSVHQGKISEIPFDREVYDVIWAEGLSSNSTKTHTVLREAHRVLQKSGRFIFSDVWQSEECSEAALKKTVDATIRAGLITTEKYERVAKKTFLQRIYTIEMSSQLELHYTKLLADLQAQKKAIISASSTTHYNELVDNAQKWLAAAQGGCMDWGILIFQKINS